MPETAIAGMSADAIRAAVRDRYSRVATHPEEPIGFPVGRAFAEAVGYPPELLDSLPATASQSFAGVAAIANWLTFAPGAVVVDLGCGAGLDTLILARQVGARGQVFGVDYSPDMVQLARRNAVQSSIENVSFIEAAVEDVPLANASVDAVVSNGIFNLSPQKERVISDIVRILKPGAVLTAAEIVLTEEVPQSERATLDDWFR
jgi:arsenite methyltransferase